MFHVERHDECGDGAEAWSSAGPVNMDERKLICWMTWIYLQENHPLRKAKVSVWPLVDLVSEGNGDSAKEDVVDLEAGISYLLFCREEELDS